MSPTSAWITSGWNWFVALPTLTVHVCGALLVEFGAGEEEVIVNKSLDDEVASTGAGVNAGGAAQLVARLRRPTTTGKILHNITNYNHMKQRETALKGPY